MARLRCPSVAVVGALVSLFILPAEATAQSLTGTLVGTVTRFRRWRSARRAGSGDLTGADGRRGANDLERQGSMALSCPAPRPVHADRRSGARPSHHIAREVVTIGAGETLDISGCAASGRRHRIGRPSTRTRASIRGAADSRPDSGLTTSDTVPTRRFSMFDLIRSTPGVSPTSPASGTVNTVSVFGSAVNENAFLIDGTNFTCPCQGVSRAEPIVDVIQEIHVQSMGASVEYGNIQGGGVQRRHEAGRRSSGCRDVVLRAVLQPDGAAGRAPGHARNPASSGYERVRYRDLTREPRRARQARPGLVLRRVSVPPRLRQPAWRRSGVPAKVRTEQDLRQGHVAADAVDADDAELSSGDLGQSDAADTRDSVRHDAARRRRRCRA